MPLATYLPRLALYWAARLNGSSIGNGSDYWTAPKLSVVTITAADQPAMDHVLESFRFWAATYRPPQVESPMAVATDEIKALRVAVAVTQACTALCRRPYPQE